MNTMDSPKTYKAAVDAGWTRGRQTLERGYISRKSNPDTHAVQVSGTGEFYVSLTNPKSSRYRIRQYLIPP